MADPIKLDQTVLNPCKNCNGARKLTHYEWRAPAYWAECRNCFCIAVADTEAEAIDLWNAENPFRELAAENELINIEAVQADLQRRVPRIETLCEHETHVVHKLPSGTYVCVQCALQLREHHELHVGVGMGGSGRVASKE